MTGHTILGVSAPAAVDGGEPGDRLRVVGDPHPAPAREFTGPEAAELAGISYRQLDYWARRRWVVPSRVVTRGVSRRVYTVADIVRLAALGHLGRSRVDVATYAEATGRLRVPEDHAYLIVWSIHDERVRLTPVRDVRRVASSPGRYVIFDPAPLLRLLQRRGPGEDEPRPRRRNFSPEYKARVLDEYGRLTEPGAKSAMLRREGLHTSHLVAWRRAQPAGAPAERAGLAGGDRGAGTERRPPVAGAAAGPPG